MFPLRLSVYNGLATIFADTLTITHFATKITELVSQTEVQYDKVISGCKEIFIKKNYDYGTSWRVLRPTSLTDQILIKAKRIKTIEELGEQMIDEGIDSELKGIINYSVIALIQLELNSQDGVEVTTEVASKLYEEKITTTKNLMMAKNHDYGEAWREMRITSFTDMILMKLVRLKQIEDNKGKTLISEGPDANYQDIINYAVFSLIKRDELKP